MLWGKIKYLGAMMDNDAQKLIDDLRRLGSPERAQQAQRYFKTGVGEYAQGDIFWGISVPLIRTIARAYKHLDLEQIEFLIEHEIHEVRLCVLLIMVFQAKTLPQKIFDLYLKKTAYINNWDLVDSSARDIVGKFLIDRDCSILYELARSNFLWERRIAIIATAAFIKRGDYERTLKLAVLLMGDTHDLIHKAVGWMLREVGEYCSQDVLKEFLEEYAAIMPRTALRYAIEHMTAEERSYFMHKKQKSKG